MRELTSAKRLYKHFIWDKLVIWQLEETSTFPGNFLGVVSLSASSDGKLCAVTFTFFLRILAYEVFLLRILVYFSLRILVYFSSYTGWAWTTSWAWCRSLPPPTASSARELDIHLSKTIMNRTWIIHFASPYSFRKLCASGLLFHLLTLNRTSHIDVEFPVTRKWICDASSAR